MMKTYYSNPAKARKSVTNNKNTSLTRRGTSQAKQRSRSDRGSGLIIPGEPRRNATDVISRWTPGFPSRCVRKLRYSSSFLLTGTSGVVATYVLSANGLYDPDITGVGHQPMGFDQLMLSYNHYTVIDSHLIATFHNLAASSPNVSLKVDGAATVTTNVDTIQEWGLNEHCILDNSGSSGANKVLESGVKIARFEGVNDALDVMELRGSVAANPAEQTYYHVQSWDQAGVSTSILTEFVLEFTAVFTEPRVLTPSLCSQISKLVLQEEKRSPTTNRS